MATKVEVYPRPGETYPDAAGVAITSTGAIVWESKYIEDALRDGFLLTYDPYGVGIPDDRTDTLPPAEGAPSNAPYVLTASTPELPDARVLAAGTGIAVTVGGPGGAVVVSTTGTAAPVDAQYLVAASHATLTAERVLTAGAGIALTPTAGALAVSSTVVAPAAPAAAPPNVASSSLLGTPGTYATAGHTHGHGDQAGGTLHAVATTTAAGFASAADKVKIDAIPAAGAAPADAEYLVRVASPGLSAERVLTAGAGITLTPAAGTLTIDNSAPAGAPLDAEYLVGSSSAPLSNERVLLAGPGITLTPGGGTLTVSSTATGGVQGPASSADNAVARWDGTTGTLVQSSLATLTDSGFLSVDNLTVTGDISVGGTVDGVDVSNLAMALANVAVPSYVTLAATPTLMSERVLTAGPGITITDGGPGGPVTIESTAVGGGGAPVDAAYLVSAASGGLSAEQVLTAGPGIVLTPGAGVLMIESTAVGGGGAPADAEYLVSAASGGLSAERVLTAGPGIVLTPGAGTLTIESTGGGGGGVQGPASSVDDALTRWDGTTGALVQSSVATLDDAGLLSTASLSIAGDIAVGGTVDGVDIAGANFAPYVTLGTNASLPNERTLVTTGGILLTDDGPGGAVTLAAPGLGASFVTLASDLNLPNERVLTAGAGLALTDGGAGGALTLRVSSAGSARSVATYTTVLTDAELILAFTNAAGCVVTIPHSSTVAYPAGTVLKFIQYVAAGPVTVVGDTNVSIRVPAGKTAGCRGTWSVIVLTQEGVSNAWNLSGDLADATRYLTLAATASHTDERVLTAGTGISFVDGGAGGALTVSSTGTTFSVKSGTAYTLTLADAGTSLSLNNAAPITLSIPSNATVPFPLGTEIVIGQGAAGQVSVVAEAGAALLSFNGAFKLKGQYSAARLVHVGSGFWRLEGTLEDPTQYLTLASTTALPNERVLTAGSGISFVDGGAGGALTINATGGGGGAPTTAQYLTLATDATLTNERVLTAGSGIALTDGGAGGALTIRQTTPYITTSAATYQPALADAGASLGCAVACVVTIAPDATANFPVGTKLYFQQSASGAAQITVSPGAGVTLDVPTGRAAKTRGANATIWVHKIFGNYWMIGGDLEENSTTKHAFSALVTGTQSIPVGGGGVQVQWNATNDPNGNFAANAYTAPRSGWYAIAVDINMGPAADASGLLRLRVNFGTYTNWPTVKVSGSGTSIIAQGTVMYFLNAGDFIDCTVIQNSAAACTLGLGTFSAVRVG